MYQVQNKSTGSLSSAGISQRDRQRPASRQSLAHVLRTSDSVGGQTEGYSRFSSVPSRASSRERPSTNVPSDLSESVAKYNFNFPENSEAINAASGLDANPSPKPATTENSGCSVGASTPENRRGPNTPGSCCLQAPLVKSKSLSWQVISIFNSCSNAHQSTT
jgi:hypothetical protein